MDDASRPMACQCSIPGPQAAYLMRISRRVTDGFHAGERIREFVAVVPFAPEAPYRDGNGRIGAGRAREPPTVASAGRRCRRGRRRRRVHTPARRRAAPDQLGVGSDARPCGGRAATSACAWRYCCADRRDGGVGVPGWLGCAAAAAGRHSAHHLAYDASSHRRGVGRQSQHHLAASSASGIPHGPAWVDRHRLSSRD